MVMDGGAKALKAPLMVAALAFMALFFFLVLPARAVRDAGSSRVSGIVRSSATGEPLHGAVASVAGRQAVTDQEGRFEIPAVQWGPMVLRVTLGGYETADLQLRNAGTPNRSPSRYSVSGSAPLFVDLNPLNYSDSNEVLVTHSDRKLLPFHFPPSGSTLEPIGFDIIDEGLRGSIQKSLFTRLRAERFIRKRDLMTDWFKPDSEWWARFRSGRIAEKEAKAAREQEAIKNYYDWLVKAINSESRDEFVDRMLRERVVNNATYSGLPQELMLKSFDMDVQIRLSAVMEEEFVRDYHMRSGEIGHSLRIDPDNPAGWGDENPFADPAGRFPGVIAPPPRIVAKIERPTGPDARDAPAPVIGPVIRGRVVEKESGKPVSGAVVVLTDLEVSNPDFFVTDFEGRFEAGKIKENRDYIVEAFFPMMSDFAEKFRVRSLDKDKVVEITLSRKK